MIYSLFIYDSNSAICDTLRFRRLILTVKNFWFLALMNVEAPMPYQLLIFFSTEPYSSQQNGKTQYFFCGGGCSCLVLVFTNVTKSFMSSQFDIQHMKRKYSRSVTLFKNIRQKRMPMVVILWRQCNREDIRMHLYACMDDQRRPLLRLRKTKQLCKYLIYMLQ